jgi:hypothetical protein
MAITDKTTIKNWFKNKLKPTQEQFWAWIDSFWHKDESIPTSKIEELDTILSNKATTNEMNELTNNVNELTLALNELLAVSKTVSTVAPSGVPGDGDEWIVYTE